LFWFQLGDGVGVGSDGDQVLPLVPPVDAGVVDPLVLHGAVQPPVTFARVSRERAVISWLGMGDVVSSTRSNSNIVKRRAPTAAARAARETVCVFENAKSLVSQLLYSTHTTVTSRSWLVLVHQIPPAPAYLRAKVGRRLARVGAVPIKNSVYVLPAGDATREHFEWLRTEIVGGGGDATIFAAQLVDGLTDAELVAMFHADREPEYREVAREARALRKRTPHERELARLETRLAEIAAIDYFGAPSGDEVQRLVAELRAWTSPPRRTDMLAPAELRDKTWVTRTGVKVDRIASAWLVRRFIDDRAHFKFVTQPYAPAPGEIRFDMPGGELTHEADRCTFEVILARAGLRAPGLTELAEIVHDIDLHDDRYGRPETAGVAALLSGLVAAHADDTARIDHAMPMLDALLAQLGKKA